MRTVLLLLLATTLAACGTTAQPPTSPQPAQPSPVAPGEPSPPETPTPTPPEEPTPTPPGEPAPPSEPTPTPEPEEGLVLSETNVVPYGSGFKSLVGLITNNTSDTMDFVEVFVPEPYIVEIGDESGAVESYNAFTLRPGEQTPFSLLLPGDAPDTIPGITVYGRAAETSNLVDVDFSFGTSTPPGSGTTDFEGTFTNTTSGTLSSYEAWLVCRQGGAVVGKVQFFGSFPLIPGSSTTETVTTRAIDVPAGAECDSVMARGTPE